MTVKSISIPNPRYTTEECQNKFRAAKFKLSRLRREENLFLLWTDRKEITWWSTLWDLVSFCNDIAFVKKNWYCFSMQLNCGHLKLSKKLLVDYKMYNYRWISLHYGLKYLLHNESLGQSQWYVIQPNKIRHLIWTNNI